MTQNDMTYGEAALAKSADPFQIYFYVIGIIGGRDFEVLTPGERIFALTSRLAGEIANGGFDQYFFNGGHVYIHEAVSALETIGAVRTAHLAKQAIEVAKLPKPVPTDYDYYHLTTEEQQRHLNELDQQFYSGGLKTCEIYPCLVEYLRKHTDEFV